MVRIVPPVKAVQIAVSSNDRLLHLGIRRIRRQVGELRVDLQAAVFLNRGDVEDGQQVQMGQTRRLQRLQMVHAVAARHRKRHVRAAILFRHRLVLNAEVAYVQLIHRDRLKRALLRLHQAAPACWHQPRIV